MRVVTAPRGRRPGIAQAASQDLGRALSPDTKPIGVCDSSAARRDYARVKSSSFGSLYSLLKGEVRPRLPALFTVFAFASLTSVAQKAPILLIEPFLQRVLFRDEAATATTVAADPSRLFEGIAVAKSRAADFLFGTLDAPVDTPHAIGVILGLIALFAVVGAASEYGFNWLSRRVAFGLVIDMRMRMARHLLSLSMRYHGQRHFGDLLSRISSDVNTTLQSVNVMLKDCTQLPLMILGSLVVAFLSAPLPTLSVVLLMPLIALPIAVLGRRVRKRSKKSLSSLGASVEVLTQMFTGIRTVKAFRAEERELVRYAKINDEYLSVSMRMVRAIASIEAWTALLSTMGMGLILCLIVWLNRGKAYFQNEGELGAFIMAIALCYGHLKRFTNAVGKVQESSGAAERLQALLDEPPDITERAGAHAIDSIGRSLKFEGVSFNYPGTEQPALADVDLELQRGETLALVGASGAGKSTLVDLIARFIDPTAGRVAVDGHDIRDLTLDSWTRQYAMVGQVPFLFHASILDNIRYGKPDATQAEVESAARAANIHEFIESLQDKYLTPVGDTGARLSGGQRQRITIARAILKGAPLLLLDEATSALDSESEAVVQEALDRLMVGRTVIVIAHRLSTIRNADRIAVLEAGRLVELGSHDELLARRGAYWRFHSVQFPAGSDQRADTPSKT